MSVWIKRLNWGEALHYDLQFKMWDITDVRNGSVVHLPYGFVPELENLRDIAEQAVKLQMGLR